MLRIFVAASFVLLSGPAFAKPIPCAGAQIAVSFERSIRESKTVEVVLTGSRDGRETVLRYDGGIDFIGVECRKTKRGQNLVLFQAYCGGSGCKDLSNFGVIDPRDLRVLLVPSNVSHLQANRIFGFEVGPISPDRLRHVLDVYDKLFPN